MEDLNNDLAKSLHRLITIDYIIRQTAEIMINSYNLECLGEQIELTDSEMDHIFKKVEQIVIEYREDIADRITKKLAEGGQGEGGGEED
jgi:hypothetical protein